MSICDARTMPIQSAFCILPTDQVRFMPQDKSRPRTDISRRQFLRLGAGMAAGALLGGAAVTNALSGDRAQSSTTPTARVIRRVHTSARKVCLTFDDLWSEFYTLKIGREYHKRGIPLTLFPIGYAIQNNLNRPHAGYENLYPRLRDMGHEFGCHLHTHRDITGFSVQQLIDEELEPALQVMRQALGSGYRPVGIRPPYGIVTDELRELSNRYHMPLILWELDSRDAICARACADRCEGKDQTLLELYSHLYGPETPETLCSKANCAAHCVDAIMTNYESYLRTGSIALNHTIRSSFEAIPRLHGLLRDWNLQPIRLSELLTYGSA